MLASAKYSLLTGRMHVKAGEKEKCHVNLASQSIRVSQNTWQSHSALKLPCNSHNGRRVSLMIYMSGLEFPVIAMHFMPTEPVRKQPAGIYCGDLHGRLSITQN